MVYCDAFTNGLECVIEYNNLITYKCILFGLLFLYSAYIIYMYKDSWGNGDNMFNFFNVMMQKSLAYTYIIFLPLLLFMLRPTVTFATTVIFIAGFYMLISIILFSLALLFSWEHIKSMFGGSNKMNFKEKMKYGRGKNHD